MNHDFTRHALVRMGQRGIHSGDIDLIVLIGTEVEGGYLVRSKDRQSAERQLKQLLEQVRRLEGKRAVIADNRVVTAYHARPARERSLLRAARHQALVDL
jgi:hypothetical protein